MGVSGWSRMRAFAEQPAADEQVPLVDAAAVGGEGRAEDGGGRLQLVHQRVGDGADVAGVGGVEGRAVLEQDLPGAARAQSAGAGERHGHGLGGRARARLEGDDHRVGFRQRLGGRRRADRLHHAHAGALQHQGDVGCAGQIVRYDADEHGAYPWSLNCGCDREGTRGAQARQAGAGAAGNGFQGSGTGGLQISAAAARAMPLSVRTWPATTSMRSACSSRPTWPRGRPSPAAPTQANYLRNVLRLKAGDRDPRLQRPRRRMAGRACRSRQARRRACASRDAGARAGGRARHRLPVRAAEARAPRLHGAEGDRDGRGAAAARADPAHDRRSGSTSSACAPMPSRRPSNAASCASPSCMHPRSSSASLPAGTRAGALIFCDEGSE